MSAEDLAFLKELLFEMPQSIAPTNFNLDLPAVNRRKANELLKSSEKDLVKSFSPKVNLYEVGRQFALIDEERRKILYYMGWKEILHKFVNHRAACQIAVWRDVDVPGYEDVAKEIFFDELLPKYGVIITDAMQTEDGRNFWVRRIGNAFNKGLNVYYLNLMQAEGGVDRELIKIDSNLDFVKLADEKDFWGTESKYKARKLIIASVDLT